MPLEERFSASEKRARRFKKFSGNGFAPQTKAYAHQKAPKIFIERRNVGERGPAWLRGG